MPRSVYSSRNTPSLLVEVPVEKLQQIKTMQEQIQVLRAEQAAAEAAEAARIYAVRDAAEQAEQDTALRAIAGFLYDPAGWVAEYVEFPVGQQLTAYQSEALTAVPRKRRIALRGPHALGKTTIAALVVLWFAVTREAAGIDWKIITTAGVHRQLSEYLWPEIHKWARRLRRDRVGFDLREDRELLTLALKLRHGAASAVASDKHENIEGAHADSLLYIFDESKAIADDTFDAAEGAFAGGRPEGLPEAFAVALSTPGVPAGRFYDIHARKQGFEDWWTRHVTLDESVAAGRVDAEWVERRRRQWGESSALFANRVLGEFHADDEDGLIPLAWVEAAVERWHEWVAEGRPQRPGHRVVGVDVARFGKDLTVLAVRQGTVVEEIRPFSKEDTMATTGRVKGLLDGVPHALAVVDVLNMGAGVVDRLREQGCRVLAFNAGATTDRRDRSGEMSFFNARSAAWWLFRELLDPAYDEGIALPPTEDDRLIADLTTPKYAPTSTGKIRVESKEDIAKRLDGRSTDFGDAVVQAFWVSGAPQPANAAVGSYDLPTGYERDEVSW